MSGEAVLRVPGDKSLSHRALLFAALADGESRLRGLLPAEDPASTASILRALGVEVPALEGGEVRVRGRGLHSLRAPAGGLDCGNSGTTARLLCGVLAGFPFRAVLDGDASLRSRPMRRVTEPLARMGASFEELGAPDRLPLAVHGGDLRPLRYDGPRASAQVKSALLLAGLTGGVEVTVSEPALSRDHTERLLAAMGADIRTGIEDGRPTVRLHPPERLDPLDMEIPGDPSSAAFFLALAALLPRGRVRVDGVGLNPTRTGILPVLARMGVPLSREEEGSTAGEPVGRLSAGPAQLRGVDVGGDELPALIDEVPILAVLGARAAGATRITGAAELRVKESDRLATMVANLRAVGVDAEELPDGLVVRGGEGPLSGRVEARGDHRIAMAFGILGAQPGNAISVDTPEVAAVSFPGFWPLLQATRQRMLA